jgi:hypothetical protein
MTTCSDGALDVPPGWARDIVQKLQVKLRMLRSFFIQLEADVIAEVVVMRPDMQVHLAFTCALAWSSAASASSVLHGVLHAHKSSVQESGPAVAPASAQATINFVIVQDGFSLGIGNVSLKASLNFVLQECLHVMGHVLDSFFFVHGICKLQWPMHQNSFASESFCCADICNG